MRISDWSSDVCSSDLIQTDTQFLVTCRHGNINQVHTKPVKQRTHHISERVQLTHDAQVFRTHNWSKADVVNLVIAQQAPPIARAKGVLCKKTRGRHHGRRDRKSTRLNSSY